MSKKKINCQKYCRICLTKQTSTKDLNLPLCEGDSADVTLIFEALEDVIGERVIKHEKYPSGVCSLCLALLNGAFDFKKQYAKTQEILKKLFPSMHKSPYNQFYESPKTLLKDRKDLKEETSGFVKTKEPDKGHLEDVNVEIRKTPSVELVAGTNSYNIKDILIVENEEPNDDEVYDAFLQNLGTVVTASFVKKKDDVGSKIMTTKNIGRAQIISLQKSRNKISEVQKNIGRAQKISLQKSPNKISEVQISQNTDTDIDNSEIFEEPLDLLKVSRTCPHCEEPLKSSSYAARHIPICEKLHKFQCFLCNEQKSNLRGLVEHVKTEHSIGQDLEMVDETPRKKMGRPRKKRPPPDADPTALTCKVCGKVFTKSHSLQYHMLHHKGKQFACEECGRTFLTSYVLNAHKINSHEKKTIEVCPVCAKTFTYKNGLYSHMKLHSKELKYECQYCKRRFRFLYTKTTHERTHTGEKLYQCSYCEKRFARSADQKKHEMYIHTKERPHKCDVCDSGFVCRYHLRVHELKHDGPFDCHICGKGLIRADLMKLHLKIEHSDLKQDDEEEENF